MVSHVNLEPAADLEALAGALRGWDLELTPLERARAPSRVSGVASGELAVLYVGIGAATLQRGASPAGVRTFGLPESDAMETRWCGHAVGSSHLSAFDAAGDFHATARAGFSAQLCSVSEERLAAACRELGLPDPDRLLARAPRALECPPRALEPLRARLRRLRVATAPDAHAAEVHEIASLLVQAVAAGRDLAPRIDPRRSQRALEQALAAIREEPRATHSLAALCRMSGASERTLRHAFQQRFGVSPGAYQRAARLAGARNELRCSDPVRGAVTRVAQRWGFGNPGDFAAHYTRLHGELPSETLRRAPLD